MDDPSRTISPFSQPQPTAQVPAGYPAQPQDALGLAAAAAAAAVNSQTSQMQIASQTQPTTSSLSSSTTATALEPQQHHLQHPSELSQYSSATATAAPPADAYPHQITGEGGPTATAPFLRDFSLVAEAAKRAQMSVMVRDLEGVSL
ncbi:hypothetical protein BO70DRAFT_195687 [Aspergillus heteromorphus CBS 117.55]|uniref:Uncharacterized protein n=1 Tax=Aspergillus heteromorphus CBS 117.55 TaxID=1448321 RepID=A0A317WQE0_9EURO|nr:uncharacterized protein BO70DRAFT_195687 [Aspergillus heteromorphus CBS 117.55]PWY87502.1 hypothetical protein BO70DRAFT_195687 [Aspergillus heteromorphus CBS 117.55]